MQSYSPCVSVIVPTYNRKHLIEPAIESVLAQTYKDYEMIVVDDASTDGTADWLEVEYPQIVLIRLAENRGPAGARNAGIEVAKGDLIAFLDSDDQWLPTYLETQLRALRENPRACLVFCNHLAFREGQSQPQEVRYSPWPECLDPVKRQLMNTFIYTMSVVVMRRSALQQVGLLNERLNMCHDRDLYIRLLQIGEMSHVPELLAKQYRHTGSHSNDHRRWAKEVFTLLNLFFADEKNQVYVPLATKARAEWALNVARNAWAFNHDLWLTLSMLARAIWYSPSLIFLKLWCNISR